MNAKQHRWNAVVAQVLSQHNQEELAIGWLRYEALRKLNPQQFKQVHLRNIAGERFDFIIDELVEGAFR